MINFIKKLLGCGKKNEVHIYLHIDNNMGNTIDLSKYIKPTEPKASDIDIKHGLGDVKIPEVEFGDIVNE